MSIIYQFISYGKAAKLANPAMAKGKRILIIAGIVVVVLALAGYGFGFYYYSRGQVADRYESATYGKFDSYASNHNTPQMVFLTFSLMILMIPCIRM